MKILEKNPFEEKNLSWIENTGTKSLKVASEAEIIEIVNDNFNYQNLDEETESFLKEKESEMQLVVKNTYTEIGKILSEAQEKLSKKGYGCFIEWSKSLGLKKDKVYSLINRYKLILNVDNSDKRNIIENIPLSLSYEISKKNIDENLKNKVLDGEIKTLKEFKNYRKIEEKVEIKKETEKNTVKEIDFQTELEKLIISFGVKKVKSQKIANKILEEYKITKK